MKVTLCGSIAFYDKMLDVKSSLESLGHEVKIPPSEVPGPDGSMISVAEYYKIRKEADDGAEWVWERKEEAIRWHFEKVEWADAVLITNYDKRGISNYVGANTLIEMGLALYLRKPIYLLNSVPVQDSSEEVRGMRPIVLNGDLSKLI